MSEKKITLNFFQLVPSGDLSRDDYYERSKAIQSGFANIDATNFKPLIVSEGFVDMYGEIKKKAGYVMGTLVHSQMSDIPPGYDKNTRKLNPLNLSDSQGLGYPTSFIFDFNANILMTEVVRNGVSAGSFCKFIKTNLDLPAFEAALVINPADYDKFSKMTELTRFEVRVAKIEDGKLLNGKAPQGLHQIMDSADKTNTNTLIYKLASTRNESLNLNTIRRFVNSFLKFKDSEEVEILKIMGRETEEDSPLAIDFIKQRLKDFITVEKQRLIGSFYIEDKYKKMEEVYDKHREGLIRIYKPKK